MIDRKSFEPSVMTDHKGCGGKDDRMIEQARRVRRRRPYILHREAGKVGGDLRLACPALPLWVQVNTDIDGFVLDELIQRTRR